MNFTRSFHFCFIFKTSLHRKAKVWFQALKIWPNQLWSWSMLPPSIDIYIERFQVARKMKMWMNFDRNQLDNGILKQAINVKFVCFVIINIIVMMCDNFYCLFEILLVLFCYSVLIVLCVRVCIVCVCVNACT